MSAFISILTGIVFSLLISYAGLSKIQYPYPPVAPCRQHTRLLPNMGYKVKPQSIRRIAYTITTPAFPTIQNSGKLPCRKFRQYKIAESCPVGSSDNTN